MFNDLAYKAIDEMPGYKTTKQSMAAVLAVAEHKLSIGHDALILSYDAQQSLYRSMGVTGDRVRAALRRLCEAKILIKIEEGCWKKSYALYEAAEEYLDRVALKQAREEARRRFYKKTLSECETVRDAWHWLLRSTGEDIDKAVELDTQIRAHVFDKGVRRITINRWRDAYLELFGEPIEYC